MSIKSTIKFSDLNVFINKSLSVFKVDQLKNRKNIQQTIQSSLSKIKMHPVTMNSNMTMICSFAINEKPISSGGFAHIYEGVKNDQLVAVKVYKGYLAYNHFEKEVFALENF